MGSSGKLLMQTEVTMTKLKQQQTTLLVMSPNPSRTDSHRGVVPRHDWPCLPCPHGLRRHPPQPHPEVPTVHYTTLQQILRTDKKDWRMEGAMFTMVLTTTLLFFVVYFLYII